MRVLVIVVIVVVISVIVDVMSTPSTFPTFCHIFGIQFFYLQFHVSKNYFGTKILLDQHLFHFEFIRTKILIVTKFLTYCRNMILHNAKIYSTAK